ncbi:DUF6174 domain-containing protein [Paractinoplanes brasiliensis]|uniref:Lipoprotein n=1 Tax=Paractinoplanes brasiliensis TaxID=52695 RepID=A0A4R6JQ98_9ACTN|nr:hypothetical protein [Actinoplanes brasiliensis]TDO37541.1 hypothetical protein C8E87_1172 [Actinoplanes brasiliensis]GID31891.1 hypothetical protein Abr02nite_68740 [Actinoplanes brasiliensis]
MLLRKLPWAVALVALAAGCTSSDPSPSPTTPAVASPPAWTEPASYSYVLTRGCDDAKPLGRYQVTVTAGAVSASDRLDATPVTPSADVDLGPATGDSGEEIEAFTLAELLEMAQTATEDGAEVATTYDTTDGHPSKVRIDVGDGPECWTVSDYKAGA